jgi:hypothetical protein
MLSVGVLLFGCVQNDGSVSTSEVSEAMVRSDIEIVSLTEISGAVNGRAVAGRISATINTGRGGRSTCQFSSLPDRFTPGTFGTHT